MTENEQTKLLDVPFYNQLDENGIAAEWRDKACGILALKMVLDFYRAKQDQPPISAGELFKKGMDNGGLREGVGWHDSALTKTAIGYGFKAWRRNWRPAARDKEFFRSEGMDDKSLNAWEKQAGREALPTLVEAVEKGHPVIISVAKNFDEIDKGHFVVLTGIKRRSGLGEYQGFYYNDPYSPTKNDRKDRYVALARFTDKWNHRAIFIEP